MTDREKILAEIESELRSFNKANSFDEGRWHELNHLKLFINTLPEEHVSEDLEEAAKNHAYSCYTSKSTGERIAACIYDFKAGAKWQKEQMLKGTKEIINGKEVIVKYVK